jgi:hypothetical protein
MRGQSGGGGKQGCAVRRGGGFRSASKLASYNENGSTVKKK